jgi:hypothetical protein
MPSAVFGKAYLWCQLSEAAAAEPQPMLLIDMTVAAAVHAAVGPFSEFPFCHCNTSTPKLVVKKFIASSLVILWLFGTGLRSRLLLFILKPGRSSAMVTSMPNMPISGS